MSVVRQMYVLYKFTDSVTNRVVFVVSGVLRRVEDKHHRRRKEYSTRTKEKARGSEYAERWKKV